MTILPDDIVRFRSNQFGFEQDYFGVRDGRYRVISVIPPDIVITPLDKNRNTAVSMDRIESGQSAESYNLQQEHNQVNQPAHYQMNALCAYDVIKHSLTEEELRGYIKGNILKYLMRAQYKGKPTEDVAKAQWYMEKLLCG